MENQGISQERVRKFVVTKTKNGYFYPKNLPRERDKSVLTYTLLGAIILLGDYLTNASPFIDVLNSYIFTFLEVCLFEVVLRTVSLFKEKQHLLSRYDGKMKNLIESVFKFKPKVFFLAVPCTLYFVWFISTYGINKCTDLKLPVMFLLYKILEMDNYPVNDAWWIERDNGLNYGSGMAYSFFYGYLQYVLPKEGNKEKNLRELMEDYEASNEIKFDVYKIFMLIPRTFDCPVSLVDRSNFMESKKSLEPKIRTVAGVKDRVYKNAVYSITHERTGHRCYVCAEYATPLKTFHNVTQNDTLHTDYYKKHKNDILLQFYLTLKQILKSQNLDNLCELIFFDDRDPDGYYYDVGKIIFNRIKELNGNNVQHAHSD